MSRTACMYSIVGAVKAAEKFLGPNRQWRKINEDQRRFLVDFFNVCREEIDEIKEIESFASRNADEINNFLKKRGFSIHLQSFTEYEFGAASVLDLLVEWVQKGDITEIITEDKRSFPGVCIRNGISFIYSASHEHPIVRLETKSRDMVFMTMFDDCSLSGFDLIGKTELLLMHRRFVPYGDRFGGLRFPMVNINQEIDIGWLKGMQTISEDNWPYYISQALQQNKLRINEIGARAQSATAIAVRMTSAMPPPLDYTINRPFLVWFKRKGLSKPIFAAYVTEEDWRNPGDISAA